MYQHKNSGKDLEFSKKEYDKMENKESLHKNLEKPFLQSLKRNIDLPFEEILKKRIKLERNEIFSLIDSLMTQSIIGDIDKLGFQLAEIILLGSDEITKIRIRITLIEKLQNLLIENKEPGWILKAQLIATAIFRLTRTMKLESDLIKGMDLIDPFITLMDETSGDDRIRLALILGCLGAAGISSEKARSALIERIRRKKLPIALTSNLAIQELF